MLTPTTKTRTLIAGCVLTLALAFAPGCSDDDSAGDNNNNVMPDSGVDAAPDAGPVGETITVRIIDGNQSEDGSLLPMEGATVTFDLPGGGRTELTTDADGRVTIEHVVWSAGTANLQGYFAEKTLTTIIGFDASTVAEAVADSDEGDLEIWLYDVELAEDTNTYVDVTGSATGFVDTAHEYIVRVARALTEDPWDGDCTSDYAISIQAETEFTLMAAELTSAEINGGLGYELNMHRVMHMDVDPLLDATTIDLDLEAYEVATFTVDASVTRDYRPESPLNDLRLIVLNHADDTPHDFGWASYSNVSTTGDFFDISHLWTEPVGVDTPYTLYQMIQGDYELYSITRIDGYPQGGVLPRLVDVPEWIIPASPTTVHPLHSEITFEYFDDVERTQLYVYRNNVTHYSLVHVVAIILQDRQVSFTIPDPPSTMDTAQLYGTNALAGRLVVGDVDETNSYWERLAVAELITLAP